MTLKTRGFNYYFSRLKFFFNLDDTVYLSIFSKFWSIIKTPLTVLFITQYLSPTYQGFWYTFLSMATLTVFAELGFTTIVVQYVSHEFAHLSLNKDFTVTGSELQINKFTSFIRFCISRYLIITPLGVAIVFILGYIFFSKSLYSPELRFVWITYATAGGLTLFTSLISSIIQGINQVKTVLLVSLVANILSTLSIWLVLIWGGKLWALTLSSLLFCIISFIIFGIRYANLFKQAYISSPKTNDVKWSKEVANLQIQYSISWIAGYFIFNFVTPVTLYFLGPVVAGKVGITFSSTAAVLQMAHSWVANKIPVINIHISRNENNLAKKLFRSLNKSSLFFFLICSCLILIILQLNLFDLQKKFLPLGIVLLVLVAEFAKLIFGNWSVYLRAYKTEPYVLLSVINGLLTFFIFVICLNFFHSLNLSLALFGILQVFVLLPAKKKYFNSVS